MGFRESGTFDTLFLIVGFGAWIFVLYGATMAWGIIGFCSVFGLTLLVAYLRHPRRKEPIELDDKAPAETWKRGRERYIMGVKARNVED